MRFQLVTKNFELHFRRFPDKIRDKRTMSHGIPKFLNFRTANFRSIWFSYRNFRHLSLNVPRLGIEIQQCSDFPETFPGNFHTILHPISKLPEFLVKWKVPISCCVCILAHNPGTNSWRKKTEKTYLISLCKQYPKLVWFTSCYHHFPNLLQCSH